MRQPTTVGLSFHFVEIEFRFPSLAGSIFTS